MQPQLPAAKKFLSEVNECQDVWRYFLLCLETPRPSTHPEKIVKLVCDLAKELGLPYEVDEANNVMIRKPATPGLEDKPSVCLQAHTDIVYQKVDDLEHDGLKDPIVCRIDGPYMKASGTTLGADNGIGIACCFGILADKNLKHGPIEVLFTSDEEIGLIGAGALKPGFIKSKYLINVDSEEENSICVGCAGGMETDFHIPIVRSAAAADSVNVKIIINDAQGGHTGVDITANRANPIKMAARMLKHSEVDFAPLLVAINGGTADNAIPRSLTFEVAVKKEKEAEFKAFIESEFKDIANEHKKTDPKLSLKFAASSATRPLDAASTLKIVDLLNILPFGPLRMSVDVEGLVETSYAVTIVNLKDDHCEVIGSGRSSSGTQMKYLQHQLRSVCRVAGVEDYKIESPYPGWQPVMESFLLKTAVSAHAQVLGQKPAVYAIHAGLECGIIMQHYPEMEAISIGPELHNPHSPDEELLIASVPRTYKFLSATLAQLAQ